jgi:hypothetical protein
MAGVTVGGAQNLVFPITTKAGDIQLGRPELPATRSGNKFASSVGSGNLPVKVTTPAAVKG